MPLPADYLHLLQRARAHFPGTTIDILHVDEIIHLDVDGHRFKFEIGSDDDYYAFSDGKTSFGIPLMENPTGTWDFS